MYWTRKLDAVKSFIFQSASLSSLAAPLACTNTVVGLLFLIYLKNILLFIFKSFNVCSWKPTSALCNFLLLNACWSLSSCLLVSLGSCFQNLKDSCLVETYSWTLLFIRFSLILPSWFPFLHSTQTFRDISFWSTALMAFAVLQFYLMYLCD